MSTYTASVSDLMELGGAVYSRFRLRVGTVDSNLQIMPTWSELQADPSKEHLVDAWCDAGLVAVEWFQAHTARLAAKE